MSFDRRRHWAGPDGIQFPTFAGPWSADVSMTAGLFVTLERNRGIDAPGRFLL